MGPAVQGDAQKDLPPGVSQAERALPLPPPRRRAHRLRQEVLPRDRGLRRRPPGLGRGAVRALL